MRILVIKREIPSLSDHLKELYQFIVDRCQANGNVTIAEMMTYQGLQSPAPLLTRLERLADRGLIIYS